MTINVNGTTVNGSTGYVPVDDTTAVNSQKGVSGTTSDTTIPAAKDQTGSASDKPPLREPNGSALTADNLSSALGATLSFGALALALIQQSTSELVRDNREIAYEAGMDSADQLEKQADKMRQQATVQLVCGVLQGALQIAGGLYQSISTAKNLNESLKLQNELKSQQPKELSEMSEGERLNFSSEQNKINQQMELKNTKANAIGQLFTNTGSLVQGIGKSIETYIEADIKDIEARQKRLDTFREQIQSITESLQDTVKQALSSMSTISQSMVESNKRILG